MRLQQRYDLYAASQVFANGAAMQAPPAGTVPFDSTTPSRGVTAAPSAELFSRTCATCHGSAGYGGSLVAADMGLPRPPSFHSDSIRRLSDAFIYDVVTNGHGRMPPYGWQLTPDERWSAIAYVRLLQQHPPRDSLAIDDSLMAIDIARMDSLYRAQHHEPRPPTPPGRK